MQVVIDHGVLGRILADERKGTSATHRIYREPPGGDLVFEQVSNRIRDLLGHLLQARDVIEDPDPSAVSADDDVRVAWMNHQIMHSHRRQVLVESMPATALIDRVEQCELAAAEEQVLVFAIFLDHVDGVVGGDVVGDLGPGLTEILGLEDPRMEVGAAMSIDGDVCPSPCEVGRLDAADPQIVVRQISDAIDHVGPCLASIAGDLHVAVVGSGPDDFRIDRRLGDGDDGSEELCATPGVVVRCQTTGFLDGLAILVLRQVRADQVPVVATVGGPEQVVGSEEDGSWVMR